eukprot:1344879-Amorphochlora_amoeboformis.AAC.1
MRSEPCRSANSSSRIAAHLAPPRCPTCVNKTDSACIRQERITAQCAKWGFKSNLYLDILSIAAQSISGSKSCSGPSSDGYV